MRRIVLLLCSAALVAPLAARVAEARPEPHVMRGRWPGFAMTDAGVDNPDFRGPAAFDVFRQDGRRFSATLSFGRAEFALEGIVLRGTTAEDGEVTMTGAAGGVRIAISGRLVTPLEERGGILPCCLDGRYLLAGAGGTERGRIVACHLMPDPAAPFLGGDWEGEATGIDNPDFRATVEASFTQGREGDLVGTIDLVDTDPRFDLAGQAVSGEGGGALAFAGGGPGGLLLAFARYTPPADTGGRPARIEGDLRWLRPDGSEVTARFGIGPCV